MQDDKEEKKRGIMNNGRRVWNDRFNLGNLFLAGLAFLFLFVFTLGQGDVRAAVFSPATTQELIDDITTANSNGEPDTINLVPGMIYTITVFP